MAGRRKADLTATSWTLLRLRLLLLTDACHIPAGSTTTTSTASQEPSYYSLITSTGTSVRVTVVPPASYAQWR